MKRRLLLVFIILVSGLRSYSCSPYAVPPLNNQQLVGTDLILDWSSATAWACSYNIFVEIRCQSNPGGAPVLTSLSGCINKPNASTIPYPASHIIDVSGLCPGETYIFRGKETPCGSSVGGSSWTSTFTFTAGGSNPFSVTASPAANICIGNCVDISATAFNSCNPSITYTWDNGAGTGSIVNVCPTVTTTYTVTASSTTPCGTITATDVVTVTVDTLPAGGVATIFPDHICVGDSTDVTLTGYNGNVQWQLSVSSLGPWIDINGATAPIYNTFPITTELYYRAILSNTCGSDTSTVTAVYPEPYPIVGYNHSDICIYESAQFINTSSIPSGNIISWLWDFGDGNTSTVQSPTYSYNNPGTYNVILAATSDYGCIASIIKPIIVHPKPGADFTKSNVCMYDAASFSDISTVSTGAITTWQWDFGDGNTGTDQNPFNQYSSDGLYNIQLIVTTDNGCSDTISQSIYVNEVPQAAFSFSNECFYTPFNFQDLSILNTVNIQTWQWDFGDGSNSVLQNPLNQYNTYGTYNVTLTIVSDSGCIDSVAKSATAHPKPLADFAFQDECVYDAAQFTDNSTVPLNPPNSISEWIWDFGDMNASTEQHPLYLYSSPGTYTVILISTTDSGCIDTASSIIEIFPAPIASFTHNDTCLNNTTFFQNSSTVTGDVISGWTWDFDDMSSSSQTDPAHLYSAYGSYNVSLTVTTSNGCVDDSTIVVEVFPLPFANFSASTVCQNTPPTQFDDNSSVPYTTIDNWQWDFGDGSGTFVSSGSTSYAFADSGTYTTTLIVMTDVGCTDDTSVSLIVKAKPNVFFSSDITKGCIPVCVNFSDISIANQGNIVSLEWDFGDGSFGSGDSTFHCFGNPKKYTVQLFDIQLIAENSNGCFDTLRQNQMITAWPLPVADFTGNPNPTSILYPYVSFTNSSYGNLVSPTNYTWDYGDGSPLNADFENEHVYPDQDTGTYVAQLVIENSYGCLDSTTSDIIIKPENIILVPNAFTPNGDGFNDGFFPTGIGFKTLEAYELLIYDRWGDLIFKSDDYNQQWDGVANKGKEIAQEDTYVWVLRTVDYDKQRHNYIGHVSLIR